jgi:hypothetical protein
MNKITINRLYDEKQFEVVPLSAKRQWMNETQDSYAYRCVPLTVANTYGWSVINPNNFVAKWNGKDDINSVTVGFDDGVRSYASSHFGSGILTIHVDFIIKTEKNISIFVRGTPNMIANGITPLDGLIETDWLPFTFTFNFKFDKPGVVFFKAGDPLFSFFPVERGFIESFKVFEQNIQKDFDLHSEYKAYRDSRRNYLDNNDGSFQKYYAKGISPTKTYDIENHQKKTTVQRPE